MSNIFRTPRWLANVRVPAQTMRDLSDVEWLAQLREFYGEENVILRAPQPCCGLTADEWFERGMYGVYLV